LRLAREHAPDLILLDLHLPDMPGWEVLAQLKADSELSKVPVLSISADATPRQNRKLLDQVRTLPHQTARMPSLRGLWKRVGAFR
jgi:CheY-like chemotaxis protein